MAKVLSVVILVCMCVCVCSELCPKQCDCDTVDGLNRAVCEEQQIVNVNVRVPKQVEVYSLARNGITELDNFCFKEAGYSSIKILNLSYNLIFWIGLHAFSGLDRLSHLDLSYNRLRYLPSDLFWETKELESLDLSGNVFDTLKNEPFLMHNKLQILNLNNCRIGSLQERLFTRLPNLRKLDLSSNYMITITVEVLQPMKKLQRIELESEYWQCNEEFIAVEKWIVNHGIQYHSICKKKLPKMMEKMIAAAAEPRPEVDVSTVWNITIPHNKTRPINTTKRFTTLEKFDKDFPASQAFLIGVELGLAIGIVGTYLWLRSLCKCGMLDCTRMPIRRQRRRMRRDGDVRADLLWSNVGNPDLETPPTCRRLSLPDRSPPYPVYGVLGLERARLSARNDDGTETPPPSYDECRITFQD